MKQARRLLKAYKVLNSTPTSMISNISCIIIYIIVSVCLLANMISLLFNQVYQVNLNGNLSCFSIVMVLILIRSIYTSFFEDKRRATKNNPKALIAHLPISKKEFILAEYISSLYLFFPALLLIISLICFNVIQEVNMTYQFQLGATVIVFSITYCLIALEKGVRMQHYVDPRLREASYLALTTIWMGLNYFIEIETNGVLENVIRSTQGSLWFENVCKLGRVSGIFLIIIAISISYFSHMKLPMMLERRNQL